MAEFDKLRRASFAGIEFLVESVDVGGALRNHVHEYPHVAGGATEKLKRKLYSIRIRARFDARVRGYPGLWPDRLDQLMHLWEVGQTDDLVVPTRQGIIRAFCTTWSVKMEARLRSGETAELDFLEDQNDEFLTPALETIGPPKVIADRTAELDAQLIAIRMNYRSPREKSLFDQLRDLTNSISAIKDSAEMNKSLLDAKLAQLGEICAAIDRLPQLAGAEAFSAVDTIHAIHLASIQMREDLASRGPKLEQKATPMAMSVAGISQWLYGSAEKVEDLLSLNVFRTPERVPAGTTVRYYALEAS